MATSFALKLPSSGQYLQKNLNAGAYNKKTAILWDPIYIRM